MKGGEIESDSDGEEGGGEEGQGWCVSLFAIELQPAAKPIVADPRKPRQQRAPTCELASRQLDKGRYSQR